MKDIFILKCLEIYERKIDNVTDNFYMLEQKYSHGCFGN